ncbi:MAG: peptidyl-prolyl cis-trans isomerase [Gammaproteobacteria bacterium]|jgi:trigger factor|nr:peptidyl-prolyl cis-trans isomerase [Gammaproteobacteria bacterium]
MQVSLSATSGLERRLEVAVPATEVASEVEQRLKQISRTARLKGFRTGKAPYAVIRKQFGEKVHSEVISDLMRSSFAQALSQEKLTPAAGPRIEPIAMGPNSDLKYAAVFEVMPEVKVKAPDSVTVERPTASVTESDVDAMIESMQRQRPVFTAVERGAHDTDRVIVDYEGRIDGQPFEGSDGTDVNIIIGARTSLPELEEGVKGAVAGEKRTVTVSFPAEHPNKALAGRSADLHLTVKRVEEQSLPAVDEEFGRAYGVEEGGIEALRIEVRKSMERELADVIRNRVRGQVLDALYRENPIDVPKALLEEQVQQLQIDTARRMGVKDASQLPPRQPFEEPARRRVALGLLMGQVVQTEQLKVDRERVQSRLNDLVAGYPDQQDEARRAYLQNQDAMRQIESAVLEDQVVDWVLARASVTDRPMSFKELTGFGQEQTA